MVILFICFINTGENYAQEKNKRPRFGLGLEVGQWIPANLDYEPDLSSLKDVQRNPYIGIMVQKPWRFGLTFRSSGGIWKYSEDKNTADEKSLVIASILFDLKYSLLSDVLVNPYVVYGAGWFLGSECANDPGSLKFRGDSEVGLGVTFGAGFDFQITKTLLLAIEFKYHYVKLTHPVVFTENYSGPKISFAAFFNF